MVRGDTRQRAVMRLHLLDQPFSIGDDPVERQHRQVGRKTRHRRRQGAESIPERIERRTVAETPFIQVSHENGRAFVARFQKADQRFRLLGAGMPEKAEMGGDDPQRAAAFQIQFHDERRAAPAPAISAYAHP